MAVNSITITIIIGEIQLESLLCCHYWNDGLPCSHCVNGQIGRPTGMESEWPIIIMECHDKLLAGKEACGYCQAGKQGEGNQRAFAIITAIGYNANKPQIMYWNPVTSLWCDMPRIVLFMSSLKAPWTQLCLLLHSESSHSHLCKPKHSSCLEQNR